MLNLKTLNIMIMASLLFVLPLITACSDSDEDNEPPAAVLTEEQATEPVKIKIGTIIDLTGPGAQAMSKTKMALDDMVEHYNEQGLIPGIELEVIYYDDQYDPSNDIPGYEWLKEKGSDLIVCIVPASAQILRPFAEEDGMMLFDALPIDETLEPPGYVFSMGAPTIEHGCYTLLKWIAENDPDFPQDRPARIGGASWNEGQSASLFAAAEEYCEAHPEQYEWVGGHLKQFTFIWDHEVEELKDCDYVIPATLFHSFAEAYRNAGHTAKFIGNDLHTGFLGLLDDADLWNEVDKTLILTSFCWWNDECETVNLAKKVLYENHSDEEAAEIIRSGAGYLAAVSANVILGLVADAVTAVGADNFNSQALYDAAQSFSMTLDGVDLFSFSKTKRTALNYMSMYEIRGSEKGLFRADPEWIPVVHEP